MTLKKYIIILLGLLLCLSAFSAQANVSYAMDRDMLSVEDAPKVKAYSDADQDEPVALAVTRSSKSPMDSIDFMLLGEIYRQPDFPPLLRPPIV